MLAMMPARTLQQILRKGRSQTAELLARSESQVQFAQRLSELLPRELRGRVRLALLEANRVVLITESAAWKARLRFHLPQITRLIRSELALRTARVEVKIAPCLDDGQAVRERRRGLSSRSAEHLRQAASALDDEHLSRALLRLAARSQGKTSG